MTFTTMKFVGNRGQGARAENRDLVKRFKTRRGARRVGKIRLLLASLLLVAPGLVSRAAGQLVSEPPALLFTIGMHIEPFGQTAQGYRGSSQADYRNAEFFDRQVEDIRAVAGIVKRHGGEMTIQAQSPFTSVALERHNSVLAELAAQGHEIALHFHEDAHLGRDSGGLPVESWCRVMQEEVSLIRQASGVERVRYFSGGNLYPLLFQAASCADLDINSDWKNPHTQTTPLELVGVNPWRPSGGTDGTDFTLLTRHDPDGGVVFLPEGQYDTTDFASSRRGSDPQAYFAFLGRVLEDSLAAAQTDKVNVFHFTVHPGEFRGDPEAQFEIIERFLTDKVDPMVAAGRVRWATFSGMADAYRAWEQNQGPSPSADVRIRRRLDSGAGGVRDVGSMTFAVNVHDWTHPEESAATLVRLVDIFERYGVKGDFYFTAEIVRELLATRPEVIERLKNSNMTISYHVRPPHPLYPGFEQRLHGLDEKSLYEVVRDYETYALDLTTGELDRSRPGGYTLVAQAFGRKPVVASAPTGDVAIRSVAQQVFRDLGAQMTVLYHESGTSLADPFVYTNGLLVRPSDFSITRTTMVNGLDNFWWNSMSAPDADRTRPAAMLRAELEAWNAADNPRPPFVTALIHENNFVRAGAEGWSPIYYIIEQGRRADPLPPPWNLAAVDVSRLRPGAEQEAIWQAYEELVATAAASLRVGTSADIVTRARAETGSFDTAKLGTLERDVTYCTPNGKAQLADFYYPVSGGPWPVAMYVHGGGWTGGSKNQVPAEIEPLRAAGFLVMAVDYRLAPEFPFPAMIEDCACAVRFLRANAGRFNIDPSHIGAWGGSAGGHLVALLGTADASAGFAVGEYNEQSSRVQAVVDMWGPADLTVDFAGGYAAKLEVFAGVDPAAASPVTWVSPDDPPFLLIHGANDPLVPLSQSQEFLARLQSAGVPASLLVVANAGHGLVPAGGTPSPSRAEVTERVVEFFNDQLE